MVAPSPLRLEARLDAPGPWLWLVKWLLILPHAIVLAFLWIAFLFTTAAALFAVLFTGRYPGALFEFNVGVLRWTWRVVYYSYGALGTDRYPPFTLRDVPAYPARLDVSPPETLSRGLVLVKWWLLAVPHYLIVVFFVGTSASSGLGAGVSGLIGLLSLITGVALLFTRVYPAGIFDLVVGLNRWVFRVAAYAALMTDDYPPFRLDQGGAEPAPLRKAPFT